MTSPSLEKLPVRVELPGDIFARLGADNETLDQVRADARVNHRKDTIALSMSAETATELMVIFREVARTAEHAAGRVGEAIDRAVAEVQDVGEDVG
jgi:hypothetical protein